jgi:hypothetical protein
LKLLRAGVSPTVNIAIVTKGNFSTNKAFMFETAPFNLFSLIYRARARFVYFDLSLIIIGNVCDIRKEQM